MTALNETKMDLAGLNAKDHHTGRSARFLVTVCFAVAGVILSAPLLWPAVSSAMLLFTAVPRWAVSSCS